MVYNSSDGRIYHERRALTLRGGRDPPLSEIAADALQAVGRRRRPPAGTLAVLHIHHEVEAEARGEGLSVRLVETLISRAKEIGYGAVTLWTNDILTAARRLYLAEGFRLVEQAPHRSFGADLTGQTWRLDLEA